ncbi:hypothetical protein AFL42_09965 [Oceanobacillus caeni]|uniref:Uncharacterized protein n=2 Tax=Bacillales TaxID=1385 RepID=A0ABR5MIW4_9BACI|nr:hypothetical protein AFL42_09965 [Oceanobacillus caeni]
MKRMIPISIILFMIIILSGCWDSKELTDISIVTILGIDKEDDKYKVTVQILNPGEIAGDTGTTQPAVNTYTETGNTLIEAIRRLTSIAPRKIYLSHLRIVIFGEEFAREGIGGVLDFLSRDHEMRTDFFFAVAKDYAAEDVLKILTPLEQIPGNNIWGMIKTSEKIWAGVTSVNIDDLVSSITSKGKEASITGLSITDDPEVGSKLTNLEKSLPYTRIETYNEGAFRNDKLVDWLTEAQTRTVNNINGKVQSTVTTIPCGKNGDLSLEVFNTKVEKKAKVKGDTPKMEVNIRVESNIADVSCTVDLTDPNEITKLEKKHEKDIEKTTRDSIKEIQEMGVDLFGFGEKFKMSNFKYWKTVEDEWDEVFSDQLEVDINVDVQIRRTGTTNQSFFEEIEGNMDQEEE